MRQTKARQTVKHAGTYTVRDIGPAVEVSGGGTVREPATVGSIKWRGRTLLVVERSRHPGVWFTACSPERFERTDTQPLVEVLARHDLKTGGAQ
jgi:hypothetical protein